MQNNISISTTKTEHRAINALESIIDNHLTMDYQLKREINNPVFVNKLHCGNLTCTK